MSHPEVSVTTVQRAVQQILKDQFLFVCLLGSAGTDRFHVESDVDLAIFFKQKPNYEHLGQLASQFSNYFDRECDLVALNEIDPIYARQILETGREISVADRSFYNLWVADQLSRYPDFKAFREIIEDNLMNRKKYV